MYATIKELHIEIEQKINQITGNLNHSFAPQYIDVMLNRTALKYIDAICSDKSNALHEGFEETTKRYDEIQNLIEEVPLLTCLDDSDLIDKSGTYSWAILPHNYYRYVSSYSDISYNRKNIALRTEYLKNIYVIDFTKLHGEDLSIIDDLIITINDTQISFEYLYKYKGLFETVNYIHDTLLRLGYKVWLNNYDNVYISPALFIEADNVSTNKNENQGVKLYSTNRDYVKIMPNETQWIEHEDYGILKFHGLPPDNQGETIVRIYLKDGRIIDCSDFLIYYRNTYIDKANISTNAEHAAFFAQLFSEYLDANGVDYRYRFDYQGVEYDQRTFIFKGVAINLDFGGYGNTGIYSSYISLNRESKTVDIVINQIPLVKINSQNDLVNTHEIRNLIYSHFGSRNRHLNPIAELINNRIRVYNGKDFEILNITLRYIRKPLDFSIITNTLSDLKITNRFIDTCVSDILLQIKDNSYQLVNNNKETE
jgi:hypothetical protein